MAGVKITQTFIPKKLDWILLITPVVVLWVVARIFDFNGLYGQDSHAYLSYSESLVRHWQSGTPKPYFFWPEGFPALGALLSFTGISCLWSLQLISLVSLIGSLLIAKKCIAYCWKKDGTLWLLLAAVTQIYFVRSGFLVMSDMLCAFLVLLTMYSALRYRENKSFRFLIVLVAAASGAFFVRYASAVILIVPLLYVFYLITSQLRYPVRLAGGIIVVAIGVLLALLNNSFLLEMLNRAGNWSLSYVFQRTILSKDGFITNTVPNGMYIFGNFGHLGYLSCGALLLPFYRKLDRNSLFLLFSVGIYLVLLVGLDTQNYRFLVVSHLPVVIALFPAFTAASAYVKRKWMYRTLVAGFFLVNGFVGWYSFRKMYAVHRFEKHVAQELKSIEHGEPIYSFYLDQSFPSYGIHNETHNFFMEEIVSFEHSALVVFNEQQFATQWKGHQVMRNWERLTNHYQLDTIRKLENNWIIYRIR